MAARAHGQVLPVRRELGTPDLTGVLQVGVAVLGLERVAACDAQVFVHPVDDEVAAARPLWLRVLNVGKVFGHEDERCCAALPGALEGLAAVCVHRVDLDVVFETAD